MGKIEFAQIKAIRPTFFFKNMARGISQVIEIDIDNPREESNASVLIRYQTQRTQRLIFGVKSGSGTYHFEIPDWEEPDEIIFELSFDGKLQDQYKTQWAPVRRWEILLIPYSHLNLHNTNLPDIITKEYQKNINKLIDLCHETSNLPEEAQFRYTIETSWPLINFIRNSSRTRIDKLVKLIKEGRIEVAALFGNQITHLASDEELIRSLYPAFRLKQLLGIPIQTAMLNHVSGLNWGLASALSKAGVRFFSQFVPSDAASEWDTKSVLPNGLPGVFNWETKTGAKLLFWLEDNTQSEFDIFNIEALDKYLNSLQSQDYPYNFVRRMVTSAGRDNAPPTKAFSDFVDKWNQEWAFPKFVLSTNSDFFKRVNANLPDDIKTQRGGLPGREFPYAATSSALELAVSRQAQNNLQTAEKYATIAALMANAPYPKNELRSAYEWLLLFNEQSWGSLHPFGAAHVAAVTDKKQHAHLAAAHAYNVAVNSLNKIVNEIDLKDDNYHLIVFNALSQKRTDVVRSNFASVPPTGLPLSKVSEEPTEQPFNCTTVLGRNIVTLPLELIEKGFDLIDCETGESVGYQVDELADPGDAVPDAANRFAFGQTNPVYLKSLTFIAQNVPSLGYKVYKIQPAEKSEDIRKKAEVSVKTLENRFYRIIVATNTGGIFSIYDKELEMDLVDGFSQYRLNQIFIRSTRRDHIHKLENVNIRREQRGSISTSLIITGSTHGCPQCVQEITIYNDIKKIDFSNRILKDATPLQEIYFAFPFQMRTPQVRYDAGLTDQTPVTDQFPDSQVDTHATQNWITFYNDEIGLTLSCIDAPVIRFGGLWANPVPAKFRLLSPLKSHKKPAPGELLKNAHLYSLAMSGNYQTGFSNVQVSDMLFRYSFTSYKGKPDDGHAHYFGISQNQPMETVFIKGAQTGQLPVSQNFVELSMPNAHLQALKMAEHGEELVARIREVCGKDSEIQLTIHLGEIESAAICDIVENNPQAIDVSNSNQVTFQLNAWDVITLKLKLKK